MGLVLIRCNDSQSKPLMRAIHFTVLTITENEIYNTDSLSPSRPESAHSGANPPIAV